MEFGRFGFGSIEIDGVTYEHDVVIEDGGIRKRKKGPSKPLRARYGHTPLSNAEDIPWSCRRLIVGSGVDGALPVVGGPHRRGRAPPGRAGSAAHGRGDRRASRGGTGDERDPSRDLLILCGLLRG